MDKRETSVGAGNGEFAVPEVIIQHIQSFMDGREAAGTSILSKSWYSAWSTRPNLHFDYRHFSRSGFGFWEFANRTMQRYEDLNLKIESFRLGRCDQSVARELISKAMKLKANDLQIDFCSGNFIDEVFGSKKLRANDINIDFWSDVVIGSETLARLSLAELVTIDTRSNEEVTCSNLKSLHLYRVMITNVDLVRDLTTRFPLLEKLVLYGDGYSKHALCDGPMNVHEFDKLNYLVLEDVRIEDTFHDYLSKFPCLKNLSIHNCYGYKTMRICSRSLERISLVEKKLVTAEFDVPNIWKFHFDGVLPSCPAFGTTCREWESDTSIVFYDHGEKWFSMFYTLLKKLSHSKISLSIYFNFDCLSRRGPGYNSRDVKALPIIHRVENLKLLNLMLSNPAELTRKVVPFLDDLFLNCQPNIIILYWLPLHVSKDHNYLLQLLCKRFVHDGDVLGVEEVNVEVFDARIAEWRSLPWRRLFDGLAYPNKKKKLRFQLKWGLTLSAPK